MIVLIVANLGKTRKLHQDYYTERGSVMNVPKRENKSKNRPIAIIAAKLSEGIDWARETLDVREIVGAKRRIKEKNGQVYYIIFDADPSQLDGYEFSDIRIAPGAGRHPRFNEIYDWATQRKR